MTEMTIDSLFAALQDSENSPYGIEPVSELEHALQCAELADAECGDDELTIAALLHDIGRVAVPQEQVSDTLAPDAMENIAPGARGHSIVGAELLEQILPERVVYCIRQHAQAKRYLCTVEPGYFDTITGGSVHTLKLQGGTMSDAQRKDFESHPWFKDALQVRRWDDRAKTPGLETRPLEHWRPMALSLVQH